MERAQREAERAYEEGEVPVGAVVVWNGALIGRAHNQVRTLRDPTAHAEILALTQAAAALENERLVGATLYVTLEPCPMCAGAALEARLERIVYGASDARAGALGSAVDLPALEAFSPAPRVVRGVGEEEASKLLTRFFRERRRGKR